MPHAKSINQEISELQEAMRSRERPPLERRVYLLAPQMVKRILRYAIDNDLESEVDAVRELLDEALAAKGF
jgi:hypothetical protein